MYLKDVLAITTANEIKIKNMDTGKNIWDDFETADNMEEMLKEYGHYYVVSIRATSNRYARKSILIIGIQIDYPI
jgi:hypothetical protein